MASSSSSSKSCKYDVFLSFRGEDTRTTFVDHLYTAFKSRLISVYKDDDALPRGESIRPALLKAIEEAQIAVVIFSKNYANSSWCLDELAHIIKCKNERDLIVMPIFYGVDPSDVRKQKRSFEEAFSKHEAESKSKTELWRKALVDASEIAGWAPKIMANGHEAEAITEIVDTLSKKLFSLTSDVDEGLVGMRVRLQNLEEQLQIGSSGVLMVGIWGVGGGGKTTVATSLCAKVSGHFDGHCIIENIREESAKGGLKALQQKILSTFSKTQMVLQSVHEGKRKIKALLQRSNVLIILDDVDHINQLDALAGSRDWFGSGSRIVITTRNQQLLIAHKVEKVCHVTLLTDVEATELFYKRAYNKERPVKNYESTLSSSVISYAAGLPLALNVLGSFLNGQDEKVWRETLDRLKNTSELEIVETLKISFDGLQEDEKELFLDIACFFRHYSIKNSFDVIEAMKDAEDMWDRPKAISELDIVNNARDEVLELKISCAYHCKKINLGFNVMELLEVCGYQLHRGIRVLEQKALISIKDGRFDMHDLIQDMARYIVRSKHPRKPEKHRRVWALEEMYGMHIEDATMKYEEIEVIQHPNAHHVYPSLFCKLVSKMNNLRWLNVILDEDDYKNVEGPDFLSNELQYIYWCRYPVSPFPQSFQPRKLVVLKLRESLQKELWTDCKCLPQLKVLCLQNMENLLKTPNFNDLPCLQKLSLTTCYELVEIHSSLGYHKRLEQVSILYCQKIDMLPTIVNMEMIKLFEIRRHDRSLNFPEIKSNMGRLEKLSLEGVGLDNLLSSIGERCANLASLELQNCFYIESKESNFNGLKRLRILRLNGRFNRLSCMIMPEGDHFSVRHYLYGSQLSCWLRMRDLFPQLASCLRGLYLYSCGLRDGEIPSDVGNLHNIQELDLTKNDFTRLHFSLLQLTRLRYLNMSDCYQLVELPILPSGLVRLKADYCTSLTTIKDIHKSCKWLNQVSINFGRAITEGGEELLESMLKGKAFGNHCMYFALHGPMIGKSFSTSLLKGNRYVLKFPENWFNEFCGLLISAVSDYALFNRLSMEKYEISGGDCEDGGVWDWEESDNDNEFISTVVCYVPFASLRETKWWDESRKEVLLTLSEGLNCVRGFGVRLIKNRSRSGSGETLTTEEQSEISRYILPFNVVDDTRDRLKFELPPPRSGGGFGTENGELLL